MVQRLLALLLVLAIWPALGETVELTVHLAQHGDLAHDPDEHHDAAPLGTDEHGCSGVFHLCASGHASVTAAAKVSTGAIRPRGAPAPSPPAPLDVDGCEPSAPPIRPPIA